MGNQYYIWNEKCPHCGENIFEFVYEDHCINVTICEYCNKEIKVDLKAIYSKMED